MNLGVKKWPGHFFHTQVTQSCLTERRKNLDFEKAMKPLKHSTFAQIYHAHHARQPEDLPFWLDLANRYPGPILELGSGTGRVFLPILQSGSRPVGLDHDRSMLAVLQANAKSVQQSSLNLIQADMGAFHFDCRFGLIILPCNTLSTLDPNLRRRMLHLVRQHLQPHGCFAASSPNPRIFKELPSHAEPEIEDIFPHPLDGEPVQVSSEWKRTKSDFILTWHYDHLQPDGTTRRYSTAVKHSLDSVQVYLNELDSAGLTLTTLYGDFDRSSFHPEAPQMIIVTTPKE
jgi:SAM-dependent methyltransferase